MRLSSLLRLGYGLSLAQAAPSSQERRREDVHPGKFDFKPLQLATVVGGAAVTVMGGHLIKTRYRRKESEPPSGPPSDGPVNPAELIDYLRIHRTANTYGGYKVPASVKNKFWVSVFGRPIFYTDQATVDFGSCCHLVVGPSPTPVSIREEER